LTIFFVVLKSRDWDAGKPGIQDWQKQLVFWLLGITGLQSLFILGTWL